MEALRTPDECFADLPDYPFAPHYLMVDDSEGGLLRMHYLDEGDPEAPVVLLMHGEPSWSFLYRKMIPLLVAAGLRCVAPDLIGFGKSDKPAQRTDHTYQRQVDWMRALILQRDLTGITLVCQDWGGLIGLRLVGEHPERFARVVAANTMLPTGDRPPGDAFLKWQDFSQNTPVFSTGLIVQAGCVTPLPPEVVAGYDAPFPEERYKEAARQLPALMPATPDNPASAANRKAWETLSAFTKPFLTAFSDRDPITRASGPILQKLIPGCAGQPHVILENGGHFLQEDNGEQLAAIVTAFIKSTTA